MAGASAKAAAASPRSVVIFPERRSSIAQPRRCRRSARALMRKSSARPETRSAYPIKPSLRAMAGASARGANRTPGAGGTLTRLPPDCDPGVGTLSRIAGEGGPSPQGWVGEGLRRRLLCGRLIRSHRANIVELDLSHSFGEEPLE